MPPATDVERSHKILLDFYRQLAGRERAPEGMAEATPEAKIHIDALPLLAGLHYVAVT